jgi:hypothetical protein
LSGRRFVHLKTGPKLTFLVRIAGMALETTLGRGYPLQPDQRTPDDVCHCGFQPYGPDRAALDSYPQAAAPAPRAIRCTLVINHPGAHLGVAIPSADGWAARFLRWRDRRVTVLDAAFCDVLSKRYEYEPGAPERCWLPRGHRTVLHTPDYCPDQVWPVGVEFWLGDGSWHSSWHR